MKKNYFFLVAVLMAMLGFKGYAAEKDGSGTVTINGQFYTFVAQNNDDPRDEPFAFTNDTYDNQTEVFEFDSNATYTLKGQNKANEFAVFVNGVELLNEAGEGETGYVATVKFADGDVVEIYETSPYVASVTIDGQFYTFVAQNADNTRDEAFAFTNDTYDNETEEFKFNPAVTYTLKGQNQANEFAVFVNGIELLNEAEEGQTGYVANVKFKIGDVVEIYETSPYKGIVKVDGQFYTFVAQNADNTRDEAFVIANGEYTNFSESFNFNPAVTYTLKGQNEANTFFVYVNGVQVINTKSEGETGYVAQVKFEIGDFVEIYQETPYVANVTINGQFYTFVAQAGDDNRNEPFAFTNDTYDNETEEFTFSPAVTYTLKGQNEANKFAVFVNGVELLNKAGEGEQGYVAKVKFAAGDVVEIYETSPYVASATISGQFFTFVAQNPANTRDEAFAFTNDTYDNETEEFNFNPGVAYTLKGQNNSNECYVYVNGIEIKNQAAEGETGFVAAGIKFAAGDVVEIYEATPYVASVTIDGQFYTFVAQAGDDNRDEAFDFKYGTYDNVKEEFNFSPGAIYTLKGMNPDDEFAVFVNGMEIKNEAGEGEQGFVATGIKFAAGDEVEIYVTTPYVASLTVDGQFYTFVAQAGEDNRDEAFVIENGEYEEYTDDFTFNPAQTYTLKGMNAANEFAVFVNGVEIKNQAGEGEQGFVATVQFAAGDVVKIFESTPYVADLLVDGQFYTFVAQNPDNTRDEAFVVTNATYDNQSMNFTFNPGVKYTLKGQNESNDFYVYVNGVRVNNQAQEGQTGFEAAGVQFAAGDRVEIYEATPYVASVTIDGQFYTFVAQAGDDNRDEPFVFTNDTYDNETKEFTFSPDVVYTFKGSNKTNSYFVYVNGIQIKNEVEEYESGYEAKVKFAAGDIVEIFEATPYVAHVTIDGQFNTFVAQNADNTRDEAFVFTNNTYENETKEFNFNPGVTYTLKGQNEANSFFVYLNGELVPNEAEEGETGYVANVKFVAGDIVEIFEASPYVATVTIDGQFYTFVAQNADNTRDEAFAFTNATYENESAEFNFNPAVTYTLKGQNEANTFFVYINDVQVANEAEEGVTGFVANVTFQIGDVVKIYSYDPTQSGINGIENDFMQNGKIYNLQGIEMKGDYLAPGIYIQNGKKYIVR